MKNFVPVEKNVQACSERARKKASWVLAWGKPCDENQTQ